MSDQHDPHRPTRPAPEQLRGTPEQLRGNGSQNRPPAPARLHPKTVAALEEAAHIEDERNYYKDLATRQALELNDKERHIDLLKDHLQRQEGAHRSALAAVDLKAAKFETGFITLKAHLSMIENAAASLQTVCADVRQVVDDEIRRAGIDPDPPSESGREAQANDAGVAGVAAAFGANARDPAQDRIDDEKIREGQD